MCCAIRKQFRDSLAFLGLCTAGKKGLNEVYDNSHMHLEIYLVFVIVNLCVSHVF